MTRARRECDQMIRLLRACADLRDEAPGRDGVDGLVHCLQTADRARMAGLADYDVALGLIHDAAKPLTETYHAWAVAELVREYTTGQGVAYLQWHSPWQPKTAFEYAHHPLMDCDRLSFDPLYPTPTLDEMVPYLERFYGIGKDLV